MADHLSITPTANGPNHVVGNFTLQWPSGHVIEHKIDVMLCRCGHSNNKPFCDGTHAKIGFRSVEGDETAHKDSPPQ
jgi:CDGSH iron-sulfur domain-containing protein 3